MLPNCATSCHNIASEGSTDGEEIKRFNSFFDLVSHDITGHEVFFSDFKGKVTVLTNVASECGYTDAHYKSLAALWNEVGPTGRVNILAFPCNQFGAQEPGSSRDILAFAKDEYGFDGKMMQKVNVNGPDADIVYKWLKAKAGPVRISWNFATYYVVSPDGQVEAYSGVEPMELKDKILGLLSDDGEL
ncbi:MAG: hypothetical protein SGILL_003399 [Bacillariaceae sp.]